MKIAMLVSGGVDSSVALCELQNAGHEVHPFYIKIWLEDESTFTASCPWQEDLEYVRDLCNMRAVPLSIVPMQAEYHKRIITYAITSLKKGMTPNPDTLCNNNIKFGAFMQTYGKYYDKVASGHYAHIEEKKGLFLLHTAPDSIKDQTYFLSRLGQDHCSHLLFPLGKMTKKEVRQRAQHYNLPSQARKDSQGLCFLGKIAYPSFIKSYLGQRKGVILEKKSHKYLGEHEGYWFYTIGQRRGLELSGGPWYVSAKDIKQNIIYVTHATNYCDELHSLRISELSWVAEAPKNGPIAVKLRHCPGYLLASLYWEESEIIITLDKPVKGVAPGQFVALYHPPYCRGSGVIQDT